MRVLYFDLPLRAYQFGAVYEIRDARNKIIFNLSGSVPIDYTAKKQFGDLLKITAGALNRKFDAVNNGMKMAEADVKMMVDAIEQGRISEQSEGETSNKIETLVNVPIVGTVDSATGEVKRKRGNPALVKGKPNPYAKAKA